MTKPVLLLAETGIVIRNLLLGTFADEVLKHRPLVVAVRNPEDARLRDVLAGKDIRLVPYFVEATPALTTRLSWLKNWQTFMYRFKIAEKATDGTRYQMRFEDANHSELGRLGMGLIFQFGRVLTRLGLMARFDEMFLDAMRKRPIASRWRDAIAEIDPAVVVSTTLTLCTKFSPSQDLAAVLAAQSLGIPCGTLIQSWDNLSSKTAVLPSDLDRYWTWSDLMTDELTTLYPRVTRGQVVVVGGPQFDFHRGEAAEPRDSFLRKLGLDPSRPVVLYGTGTAIRFPHEVEHVIQLVRAMRAAAPEIQALVRLHPKDNGERWDVREADVRELEIVVQRTAPAVHMDHGGFVPPREFYRDQVSALTHAAVVVNTSSTITIDAAILDRPIVCLAYDVVPDPRFPEGLALTAAQTTHFAPLVATGGMRVVKSESECVDAIRLYVGDPSLDREQRKGIVALVAGKADGRAGRRLAAEVTALAASHSRRAPLASDRTIAR